MSGLNVVVVVDTPRQMSEGNWRVGMFMDDQASDEQAEKLGAIFSGQMGGPLANLVPLISENLGMEVAPIEYIDDGIRHQYKVGDAIDVEIEDLVSPFDPDGPLPKLTETRHPANSELTPARTLSLPASKAWGSTSPVRARAGSLHPSLGRSNPSYSLFGRVSFSKLA